MKTISNIPPEDLKFTDINATLSNLKTTYNQSFTGQTDMAMLAKTFEQAVVNANSGIFTKLTNEKIAQINNTANTIPTDTDVIPENKNFKVTSPSAGVFIIEWKATTFSRLPQKHYQTLIESFKGSLIFLL